LVEAKTAISSEGLHQGLLGLPIADALRLEVKFDPFDLPRLRSTLQGQSEPSRAGTDRKCSEPFDTHSHLLNGQPKAMPPKNQSLIAILEVSPASRVEFAPELEQTVDAEDALTQPRLLPLASFPFRIGRGEDNHASIQDRGMSRDSIEIRYEDGQLELFDLGQRSGVLINGDLVAQRQTLQFDDVITCPNADVKITLREPPVRVQPDSTVS
jgi:hypothetical protein